MCGCRRCLCCNMDSRERDHSRCANRQNIPVVREDFCSATAVGACDATTLDVDFFFSSFSFAASLSFFCFVVGEKLFETNKSSPGSAVTLLTLRRVKISKTLEKLA